MVLYSRLLYIILLYLSPSTDLIEFAGSSNTSLGRIHADSDIQKFPGVQIVGSNYGAIYLGGYDHFSCTKTEHILYLNAQMMRNFSFVSMKHCLVYIPSSYYINLIIPGDVTWA